MISVFFIHGNPGNKSDWDILLTHLPKDIDAHIVDSYKDDWIEQIKNSSDKVLIVAHSWGCYRVLKNYNKIKEKVERVFLINPYLVQEKSLSSATRGLLAIPMVGDLLLKNNHKNTYIKFVEDMIYPQTIKENLFYNKKMEQLSNPESWSLALKGKIFQQENPITESTLALGYAYLGSLDKGQDNNIQAEELKKNIYIRIRNIENGGHGLLWSHPEFIARDINHHIHQIGYIEGSSIRNNVISYMGKHVEEHKDKIALRWAKADSLKQWDGKETTKITHDHITFEQLDDRIARFAQGLLNIGIKKGDRVIIFLPMSVDMYISMFAVQRIGAIAVFLDSWARSHHLGASAECVQPKAMISFDMAFQLVDQVPEFTSMPIRILYGPGEKFTHKYSDLFAKERSHIEPVQSEDTALITFTTGSTGKPKGANRTHRFLSAQHMALTHVIPYTLTDLDMPAFPIFSLNSLATGVSTVLPAINLAQPAPTDSALLANQIINENINCTTLSPSMLVGLAKFCKDKNIILSGLRRVVTGGAPISKDDVRAFYEIAPQTDLWILYGSTEAEPMAHIEGREMLKEATTSDPELVENGVNVGEISEDIGYKFIKIINGPILFKENKMQWKDLEVVSGEVGEFICTGDHVCRDYYNNPDAFRSTKILDDEGRVWHRTGDLAYQDAHKQLWIVGRVNNAIIRNQKYYFPVQAEVLLKRMSFTYRCAFLGIQEETVAVIELNETLDQKSFNFENARTEIKRVFSKNNIPVDHIKFVTKIPMDPRHHSKVEYGVLRELLQKQPEVIIG